MSRQLLIPMCSKDLGGWSKWNVELHMRWTLFNWLLDVASPDAMNLSSQCLFLAFSIIDRHLEVTQEFSKGALHILGMTALFIASKIQGEDIPEAEDFVYYMDDDNQYTLHNLIRMEKTILAQLDFRLFELVTTTDHSCVCYTQNPFSKTDQRQSYLLFNYLWDLCLLDYRMQPFSIWDITAAGIPKVCKMLSAPEEVVGGSNKSMISAILDSAHEEKLRIDTGKRTAIQRKHTRLHESPEIINLLFSSITRLKQLLIKQPTIIESGCEDASRKRKRCDSPTITTNNKTKVRGRCTGLTKRGKRCKLSVLAPECEYCWKHV